MPNPIKIVFESHYDRAVVTAALTAEIPYNIDIINNCQDGEAVTEMLLSELTESELGRVLYTLDKASNAFEADTYVWKIKKTDHAFDLTDSYHRTGVLTDFKVDMTDGMPIKVKFEIPGFSGSNSREIDLWYNQDFSSEQLAYVAEIGIVISGNGASFSITNTVECMVSFSKSPILEYLYAIDFPLKNEIIVP